MIQEVIVTTRHPKGRTHCAPMGIRRAGAHFIIAPFRPSTTLDFLLASRSAVVNYTDDMRIFAGCLTGRANWPLVDAQRVPAPRLADALAHTELELQTLEDDPQRPHLLCRSVLEQTHGPFQGFNRAQGAVLELAILVSRLNRLPQEQVSRNIAYLGIAMQKTAGPREQEAWDWLMKRVAAHQSGEAIQ